MTLPLPAQGATNWYAYAQSLDATTARVFTPQTFGAVGNGTADDTTACQAAITAARAAGGGTVHFPAGTYRLTAPLVDATGGDGNGLTITGVGKGSILKADFSGGSILTLNGTGILGQFMHGGKIIGLTFTQTTGKTGVNGVQAFGVWHQTLERLQFTALSGDGVSVPDRSDLNANPDFWASVLWEIRNCRMDNLGGWGVNSAAGVGFSAKFLQCYVNACAAGGIRSGGHYTHVSGGAIASCGTSTGGVGLFIERQLNVIPHGLVVQNVEFDGNWNNQILIQAAVGWSISSNRFVSRFDAGGTAYRDRYIVQLGDSLQQLVEGGRIAHNAIAPLVSAFPLSFINYFGANSAFNEEFGNFRTVTGVTGFGMRAGSTTGLARTRTYDDGGITWNKYGPGGTLPPADVIWRGTVRSVEGGTGVADQLFICRKDASENYAWVPLY